MAQRMLLLNDHGRHDEGGSMRQKKNTSRIYFLRACECERKIRLLQDQEIKSILCLHRTDRRGSFWSFEVEPRAALVSDGEALQGVAKGRR
jgi:hypothetical protein